MNPFGGFERYAGSARLNRWRNWALLSVLMVPLAVGFGVVTWRTIAEKESKRARARVEALALAKSLELQIHQAISAAEVLGAWVKQAGGALSFPKAASEVLSIRPGVAFVELQPGGIVTDVFPRPGNERAVGFNSLHHPAYRQSANAALQRRVVTLAGPLKLHRGEVGLLALAPVYLPVRDHADTFWGLVSAAVAFPDMLARAHLNDLGQRGYCYAVVVLGSAEQPAVLLAESGTISMDSAVQHSLQMGHLELRLALQPTGGWVSWGEVGLECAVVLALSGLVFAALMTALNQREITTLLTSTQQQLAGHSALRTRLERENQTAHETAAPFEADLQQVRSALEQTRLAQCHLQAQLDEATHATGIQHQSALESLADADRIASDLRLQLDQTTRVAQQATAERARIQSLLETAQKAIRVLETRLEETSRAQKEAAAAAQRCQETDLDTIADLQLQLEAARNSSNQPEPTAIAQPPSPTETTPTPADPEIPAAARPSDQAQTAPASLRPTPAQIDHQPTAEVATKVSRPGRRRPDEPQDQMNLWTGATPPAQVLAAAPTEFSEPSVVLTEQKNAPSRAPAPQAPPAIAELRRAFHQILPLLVDHDPGAADCLSDNCAVFQSAFSPEDFVEFQAWTSNGKFNAALEHLKKAAKRHNCPL